MFKQNKYTKCYYNIITRAQARILNEYKEIHHVIPKSLGGSDENNNLVALTAREHYICHLLLPKMTSGAAYQKMLYAYTIMSGRNLYNSKRYEFYRREYAKVNSMLRSGSGNGMFGADRKGEKNTFYGKTHSEETKRKISEKKKGVSISMPPFTDQHKKKLSEVRKDKTTYTWTHDSYGTFIGTKHELAAAFPNIKFNLGELGKVASPNCREKSHRGWQIT